MADPNPNMLLDAAQARIRGACLLLARPRACCLDECITQWREAQGYLEWLRDSLAGRATDKQLRAQIMAAAVDIRQAGILLEQAARSGRRWLDRLQTGGGYTADGTYRPLSGSGRISFFG
ncbi:MAG: hypothetical protein ABSH50_18155 [Bryobacteraceae bacterium]|jgi:hypothetical protein